MGQASTNLGSAPRSGSSGTNNLPPILFHQVHGDNIRISGDGSVARRVESFCRGVAFSSRPIKVNEKVYVRFLEVSNNWSGVLRFGFTSNDPSNLRYSLPKYACPDLTSKPGYWAKALAERFAEPDNVLYYYVTHMGDVYFGINGEEKGIILSGIDTRGLLWALFDVYGNSTGIELMNRSPLNNSRRILSGQNDTAAVMDAHILPSLQSLCIQNSNQRSGGGDNQTDSNLGCSSFQQTGTDLVPLPFHTTRGFNIRMSNDRLTAARNDTEFCLGYVFTSRPVVLGERIVIQVLATETMYAGALAFGLTSCDPSTLQPSDLPEDSNCLLDRPEYWVVQKNVANTPQRGDELTFSVLPTGEVQFSKNGNEPVVFMHVDQTLRLWAFFDVYGATQKIRILGSNQDTCNVLAPWPRGMPDMAAARRMAVRAFYTGESSQIANGNQPNPVGVQNSQSNKVVPLRHCCVPGSSTPAAPAEVVQFQPAMGGGTVLVVNLPPAHSNFINHQQQQQTPPTFSSHNSPEAQNSHSNVFERSPTGSGILLSSYSNNYPESVSGETMDSTMSDVPGGTNAGTSSECSICYERSVDSVLYMCGHMCMCYDCAVQQWRGKGGGHCPMCRAVIRDVIRTYKS